MKKVFLILAVCFMSFATANAQSVGYVDTEKILSCIQEYLDAQKELNSLAEKYKADIQKDVDAIDALYRDYMAKKSSLSTASQQAKENEIIAKEKAVKEKEESYFGEEGVLTKRSEKLISPIQEVVEEAIQKVAASRGCSMVLDLTVTIGIVYKDPKYELTNAVIDYLRELYNYEKNCTYRFCDTLCLHIVRPEFQIRLHQCHRTGYAHRRC